MAVTSSKSTIKFKKLIENGKTELSWIIAENRITKSFHKNFRLTVVCEMFFRVKQLI